MWDSPVFWLNFVYTKTFTAASSIPRATALRARRAGSTSSLAFASHAESAELALHIYAKAGCRRANVLRARRHSRQQRAHSLSVIGESHESRRSKRRERHIDVAGFVRQW